MDNFCGIVIKTDIYNGVHIDLAAFDAPHPAHQQNETLTVDQFANILNDFLNYWIKNGVRCAWFRVPSSQSHFISALIKHDFQFHHAKYNYVMLLKWIKADEEMKAPNYAHSMLGVGGLVYNPATKKVLLVQEKTSLVKIWKFPGGYAEPGEHIFETALREVFEETGLECDFHSVLTFRHRHNAAFGCSDFYFVCLLQPKDPAKCDLKICQLEIEDCRWFDLDEALNNLCAFNKYVFERFLSQFENHLESQSALGHTINSELIHSRYSHIELKEMVYALGPIAPLLE